jgi:hypothetical protein
MEQNLWASHDSRNKPLNVDIISILNLSVDSKDSVPKI